MSAPVTPRIFAAALLGQLGLPISPNNLEALIAAQALEGGFMHNGARFNPLNTTMPAPGAVSVTSVGVKAYDSWPTGLEATAKTLRNGLYGPVLASLQASAPPDDTLRAIELSPWGWYHIDPGTGAKVPNPIARAANLQYEADKAYPAGGGALPSAGGTPSTQTIGLVLLAIAAAVAYGKGHLG